MSFSIRGLPAEQLQDLFALPDDELKARNVVRRTAAHNAPCRVSLTDANIGDETISKEGLFPGTMTWVNASGRADMHVHTTFGEVHEVVIPMKRSPGRPSASTCRANTKSKPKSLAAAVRIELSVVRAIAGRPRRAVSKRPVSSVAMCWLSAALPPLPAKRSLPPLFSTDIAASASAAAAGRSARDRSKTAAWSA